MWGILGGKKAHTQSKKRHEKQHARPEEGGRRCETQNKLASEIRLDFIE
jgi:hypothetical protein